MSAFERTLDPSLLEIMADLQCRDVNSLFGVSPTKLVRALHDGSALLRPGRMNQSAAMNALLRVHREELAYALSLDAYTELLNTERGPWRDYAWHSAEERAPREAVELANVPCFGSDAETEDDQNEHARATAAAGVSNSAGNPADKLVASLRLAPSEASRIIWAVALWRREMWRTAERILTEVESDSVSVFHRSCAANDLGVIGWNCGDIESALDHFLRAKRTSSENAAPAAYALVMAWLLGETKIADELSAVVERRFQNDRVSLRQVEADFRRIPVNQAYTATLASSLRRAEKHATDSVERIARALAHRLIRSSDN